MFVSAFFVKTNLFQLISDLHFYDCDLFMFINVCFLFSKKLSRRSLLRDCRPAKHIITDFDQKRKLSRYSRFTELGVWFKTLNPTQDPGYPVVIEKNPGFWVCRLDLWLHSKNPFFFTLVLNTYLNKTTYLDGYTVDFILSIFLIGMTLIC